MLVTLTGIYKTILFPSVAYITIFGIFGKGTDFLILQMLDHLAHLAAYEPFNAMLTRNGSNAGWGGMGPILLGQPCKLHSIG